MQDDDGRGKRELTAVARHGLAGVAGGAGSVAAGLLAQLSEIELSVAGVAGLMLTLVVRFRMSDGLGARNSTPKPPSFEDLRDADVGSRNDAGAFREYRRILAEAHRQWSRGELRTAEAWKTAKNSALALLLNMELLRVTHVCKRVVQLVIVHDADGEFVVKRVEPIQIGSRLRPGMRCHHDTSLDALAETFASHHYSAEFHACGETYHLVALSDAPLSTTARAIVEDAAAHYQGIYQFFRVAAIANPPAREPAGRRR